jgi:copper chaperone CopZ
MMYGDHHVLEVRKLLLALPGVGEVYASSAFQIVEVSYDPAVLSPEKIQEALETAGYLGDLELPRETGALAAHPDGQEPFLRHTEAHIYTRETVSFTQKLPETGRPLWPCPGIGVLTNGHKKQEVDHA